MALQFVYREAEPARQAIAQLQLEAAIAENASRERIAKEQTAASRYATQAQLSEREKDRAVTREDIASRERSRTGTSGDAASRERGNIQYQTILGEISESDPMTKRELEARIAANPQITEDLANNLRSVRDAAYKIAKSNYATGQRLANNYKAELAGKGVSGKGLDSTEKDKIYEQISKDKNVIFDRATGNVESLFRAPREDGPEATSFGGAPSRSQMMGRAGVGAAAPSTTVPTIADVRARITGAPAGLPATQSTPQPSPGFTPRSTDFAVPQSYMSTDAQPRRMAPTTPPFIDMSDPSYRAPAVAEMLGPTFRGLPATPPIFMDNADAYGMPGVFSQRSRGFIPRATDFAVPRAATSADLELDELRSFMGHPRFQTLNPDDQAWIIGEVERGMAARMRAPRISDLQTLRPEYVPMDPYLAPQ